MAKSKSKPTPTTPPPPPQVFEASLGAGGSVVKGASITQAEAEVRRKAGQDVVVCGPELSANRRLAKSIERGANGIA